MIGTGYVGLVSGACFADFGHHVICVDKDADKIAALQRGEMPIYEPGLDELVAANVKAGRLRLHHRSDGAGRRGRRGVHRGRHAVAARRRPRRPVLRLRRGARDRRGARRLHRRRHQIDRAGRHRRRGRAHHPRGRPDADFAVVSNPEFLREGAAIHDFKHPDRIVVGTDDARARKVIGELYRPLYLNQAPIMFTGRRTAELIKYAANAFLATKITFINEIADCARRSAPTCRRSRAASGSTTASAAKFLHAGPGFGGSCFPKDTLRADQDRAGPRRAAAHRRGGGGGQRRPQARDGAQGGGARSAAACAARPSRCSA